LGRLRWAVRATLGLGVAASVAANVLHAEPDPVSQAIAAWPPLALLLTVELISRVPTHRRSLGAVRLAATAAIAGIAAWVSYWHMAAVAARYGESGASPYLLPVSVDGLVIVASVSLVEIAARIRACQPAPPTTAPRPDSRPADAALQPPHAQTPPDPPSTAVAVRRPVARAQKRETDRGGSRPDGEQGHAPAGTAEAVAYWCRRDPDMHPAQIAARVGRSERTVRRYWPPAGDAAGPRTATP
jgi:hypothetical protein